MGFVPPEFGPAMAEVVLALGICVVLIADLFISGPTSSSDAIVGPGELDRYRMVCWLIRERGRGADLQWQLHC